MLLIFLATSVSVLLLYRPVRQSLHAQHWTVSATLLLACAGLLLFFWTFVLFPSALRPSRDGATARQQLNGPLQRAFAQLQESYTTTGRYQPLPESPSQQAVRLSAFVDADQRGFLLSAEKNNHRERLSVLVRDGVVVQRSCSAAVQGCVQNRWQTDGRNPKKHKITAQPASFLQRYFNTVACVGTVLTANNMNSPCTHKPLLTGNDLL